MREYWIIGSNRWSKDRYTEEQAIELSKTLVNCANCIDCKFCEDCKDCSNCGYCKNCTACHLCFFIKCCEKCGDVDFSHDLKNQRKVRLACWEGK